MNKHHFRCIALRLLCWMAISTVSFAVTNPLSYPYGLALDAKGNLYVGNFGQNDILVYNPNYKQLTANTITDSIAGPLGIAFDSYGDLWAGNYNNVTLVEFAPGKQFAVLAANAEVQPAALAIDGSNNVWVQGGVQGLGVFDQSARLFSPVAQQTGPLGYGLATHRGWVAMGGNSGLTLVAETTPLVVYGDALGNSLSGDGVAIASDANDNFYIANSDGSVNIYNPNTQVSKSFVTLTFVAGGLVVDTVRRRVYFSDSAHSQILVYNTAGTLLHTIH